MSGFKNKALNSKIKECEMSFIIEFVFKCLDKMRNDLIQNGQRIPNNEEKIRNHLLDEYLQNDQLKKENGFDVIPIRFEPESPENYDSKRYIYVGRVDIKILTLESFMTKNAYNIIECKRLDGSNPLNGKYVEDGLKRFITDKKYSNYKLQNVMLGFIVKKINVPECIKKIKELQESDKEIKLKQFERKNQEQYLYEGVYQDESGDIKIWHMFDELFEIIENE